MTNLETGLAPVAKGPDGVRVGVDIADIDEVHASLLRHGDRYTGKIFTARETGDTAGPPAAQAASLAARFAAKEAVMKVLRPGQDPPEWTDIEIAREPGGWCSLHLSGRASDAAAQARLGPWAVSLTHEGRMAVAVVVASESSPTPSPEGS